ncbi:MAG: hypothetical protein ACI8RD_010596 [Bacillariaceae sp.]|jgi:hypothetical protein
MGISNKNTEYIDCDCDCDDDDTINNDDGEFNSYYTNADDESDTLIPIWKDDDDDDDDDGDENDADDHSGSNSEEKFHRIPSTLEFHVSPAGCYILPDIEQPVSISNVTSHHSLSMIDTSQHNLMPIITDIPTTITTDHHHQKHHDDEKQEQRPESPFSASLSSTNFRSRRRSSFQNNIGVNIPNRLFHRSSRTTSVSTSTTTNPSPSSRANNNNILNSTSRLVLMMGATVLVMLSVHDSVQNSRQFYRQQYQQSDHYYRREEFEFPLNSAPAETTASTNKAHLIFSSKQHHQQQQNQNKSQNNNNVVELPKYYLPKLETRSEQRGGDGTIRGGGGGGSSSTTSKERHYRSNLAMARSQQQARPIFVPDQVLPDGGFRKPVERFIFDQQQQQSDKNLNNRRYDIDYDYRSTHSSWTSWMASLALIGVIIDTGWKEYQRSRFLFILPRNE